MIPYVQCRKCINQDSTVPKGYILKKILAADGRTEVEVLEECQCHKEWKKSVSLEGALTKANISSDILSYKIDSYVGTKSKDNVERLVKFVKRSTDKTESKEVQEKLAKACLYMFGPNGTQKTTLAKWAGLEFLKAGKSVYYTLMNDLLKLLQKADRDEEIQAKIEKILDKDLLIIDESFMKERVLIYKSQYQLSFLDSFLRNRIQTKGKGVMFISNISTSEIDGSIFGDGIKDLVVRNTILSKGDLYFEDNYTDNMSAIDEEDLF